MASSNPQFYICKIRTAAEYLLASQSMEFALGRGLSVDGFHLTNRPHRDPHIRNSHLALSQGKAVLGFGNRNCKQEAL